MDFVKAANEAAVAFRALAAAIEADPNLRALLDALWEARAAGDVRAGRILAGKAVDEEIEAFILEHGLHE